MGTRVGKLSNAGDLFISGAVNERLPSVLNGLVAHYPMDATVQKYIPGQIRYIRDWLNGNTVNALDHWLEIQAFDFTSKNVALNKFAYANGNTSLTCPALVDGIYTDTTQWNLTNMADSVIPGYRTIDLGQLYNLKNIIIWHYYGDGRTYHNTKTEVSDDGIHWYSVFDSSIESEYVETSAGHNINLHSLGTTCMPSVNINTTITNNGVAVEQATTNLIPGGTINSYPTYGNGWGTYNTNQYNNNSYFSIGTISSVNNNIVTTASAHPLRTYDVVTPQTTGGGVTAGTNYFVKKISSTQFALYQYNGSQDGSQGYVNPSTGTFKVYDSIALDQKVSVNITSFPNMWWGPPHLPNSGLVKEIIPNGFINGVIVHNCIRLHTEHRTDGVSDGMAFNVNPPVTSGLTYTFSFYARAVTPNAIGQNVQFEVYDTNSTYPINGYFTLTNQWQKYSFTASFPNTTNAYLYWFPPAGMAFDLAEIQHEQKSFPTSFTPTSRGDATLYYHFGPAVQSLTAYTVRFDYMHPDLSTFASNSVFLSSYNGSSGSDWIGLLANSNTIQSISAASTPNVKHTFVVTYNGTNSYWYLDGTLIKTETSYKSLFSGSDILSFSSMLGWGVNTYLSSCTIKALSVYNRVLTQNEIISLSNKKFMITNTGNIYSPIKERPNSIPNDCYYFPLGLNSKDQNNNLSSSNESNTVYDKGSVWVGSSVTNLVPNPTGKLGATAPGSCAPGWDVTLHPTAIFVNNWNDGYNSGVPSPSIGYHAQWVYEGIGGNTDPCVKFIDLNNAYGLGHRWLGVSNNLGIPSWTIGTVVTLSWNQKSDTLGKGGQVGVYHFSISSGTTTFGSAINSPINVSKTNSWERVSFTFTVDSDWDLTKGCTIYVYGSNGNYGTLWIDNVQIEQRSFATPFTSSTRGASILNFNLNSLIGLDWSQNWGIVYFKKPIGASDGTSLTAYNIESLGCNGNTNGGYFWWGKNNPTNVYMSANNTGTFTGFNNSTITPSTYFGNWQMISVVKNGATITIKIFNSDAIIRVATFTSCSISTANYYVNQYGCDLTLGGYNNSNPPNTYYRDLIVAKRALLDSELQTIAQSFMKAKPTTLQVQGTLIENAIL